MFNAGKENPMWKGDDAGIDAIHEYVRARKPKPEFCECCGEEPPRDLANISQKYMRDVEDFEWLCRRCHMNKDGRLEGLRKYSREVKPPIECSDCGETKKHSALGLCQKCYDKVQWQKRKQRGVERLGITSLS